MSIEPISRELATFGTLLVQYRVERKWTVETFAAAIELPVAEVESMECGYHGPTLPEFFRIARALRLEPAILFVDLVAAWRADPSDLALIKSRPSDFAKLYRLGYSIDAGDFRELPAVYGSEALALQAAIGLNHTRKAKGQPQIDALLTYVRLEWTSVPTTSTGE